MQDLATIGLPALFGGVLFFFVLTRMVEQAGFFLPRIQIVWKLSLLTILTFFVLFYTPVFIDRFFDGRDIFHSMVFVTQSVFFWSGAALAHAWCSKRGRRDGITER